MQQYYPPIEPGRYPSPSLLKRPIRTNTNIVCLGLLLMYFLSMQALPFFWGALIQLFSLQRFLTATVLQSLGLVNFVVSFSAAILLITQLLHMPMRAAVPLRPVRPGLAIPATMLILGTSVMGVLLSGFLATFLDWGFGLTPVMPDIDVPTEPAAIAVYAIYVVLIPAVFEEVLFRGVVLQSLRRFGDRFALWVSAFLFACAHGNLVQGPNALLAGLVIGYFVLRTGSLVTGMVMHLVNNGLAVGLDLAARNIGASQAETLNLITFLVYVVVGVAGLIWLLVGHTGMFRIMPSQYPLTDGRKFAAFFCSVFFVIFLAVTCIITRQYLQ